MSNYTITKFKVTETIGDSIFRGNMVNSGTMTITPNVGYVVTASDFSVSTVPSQLSSVVFTDTGVAGQPSNTVTVTSTFETSFIVTKNITIKLDIIGDAKPWQEEEQTINTVVRIVDDNNNNNFGSITVTKFNNYSVNETIDIGTNGSYNVYTNLITGNTTKNTTTKISTITVDANTGYYFFKKPYLKTLNTNNVFLKQSKVTKTDEKYATSYTFDIMFNSNKNTYNEEQQPVFIVYSATALPVKKKEITNVVLGDPIVSDLGETRPIKIYGNVDAEFDLTITKNSDEVASVINLTQDTLVDVFTENGTIKGVSKKIERKENMNDYSIGYCTITQVFPKNIIRDTTTNGTISNSVTMNVVDNDDVAVGDRILMSGITNGKTIKVTEVNPGGVDNRLTLSEAITVGITPSPVKFLRTETYNINLYPKSGTNTTLGPNIPTIKPHFSVKQYVNPVLTLKATCSTGVNPGDVIFVGRANTDAEKLKHLPGAISGTNATVTSKHNINYFQISYSLAASSGNWGVVDATLPKWSSTNSTDSSWTNSVSADNGGTHIEILSRPVASGLGTSTLVLTVDVLVKQWGDSDVTMTLDLDPAYRAA